MSMTNYRVIKNIILSALLWICFGATDIARQKHASDDTKVDFSFLENGIQHEDWIDPFNMFEYKPSSSKPKIDDTKIDEIGVNNEKDESNNEESANEHKQVAHSDGDKPCKTCVDEGGMCTQKLEVCAKTAKFSCKDEEFIYLKRTANMILNKVEALKRDSPSTVLHVILTITEDVVGTLKAFLGSPCKHVQEFDSTIATTLNSAELTESYSYLDSAYSFVHQRLQSETALCFVATFVLVLISGCQLLRLPVKQIISRLIIITFILSFIWNWILLIKMETANAHAKVESAGPDDCHNDKMGTYKKVTLILSSIFFPSNDKCKQYYEAVLVEPIWKVTPLQALSKTFSELFFHPLGLLGQHLGKFFQNLFSAVSWYLLLPVSIIVTIIILLTLLLICGYRIRLPFFFTIEPGHQQYTREQNQLIADVLEGKVHIQRINFPTTSESPGHSSNCIINSVDANTQRAIVQEEKKTSTKENKGIQTNVSELNSLHNYLIDGKVNGKIQDLEILKKNNIDTMHEEE